MSADGFMHEEGGVGVHVCIYVQIQDGDSRHLCSVRLSTQKNGGPGHSPPSAHGYPAHDELPPSLGLPWVPEHGPTVGSQGGGLHHGRGTPAHAGGHVSSLCPLHRQAKMRAPAATSAVSNRRVQSPGSCRRSLESGHLRYKSRQ